MPESAAHVRVTGRVQGVGFRWWTQQRAEDEGLAGWVRNLADGRVELHAQGEESALGRLLAALHDGPPHARVTDVEVTATEPEAARGFEIRPTVS